MKPLAANERIIAEVEIAAPIDTVWQALRDPALIRQWFGWDYPDLPGEIDFIFDKGTTPDEPAHSLQFGEWQGVADRFDLETRDRATVLRLSRQSPGWPEGWESTYDDVVEGWISFIAQLRLLLEKHPGGIRRTIYLSGKASPDQALPSEALGLPSLREFGIGDSVSATTSFGEPLAGSLWHTSLHQVGIFVPAYGNGLLIVTDRPLGDSHPNGGGSVIITTFGLNDAVFTALEARWTSWWQQHYPTTSSSG